MREGFTPKALPNSAQGRARSATPWNHAYKWSPNPEGVEQIVDLGLFNVFSVEEHQEVLLTQGVTLG